MTMKHRLLSLVWDYPVIPKRDFSPQDLFTTLNEFGYRHTRQDDNEIQRYIERLMKVRIEYQLAVLDLLRGCDNKLHPMNTVEVLSQYMKKHQKKFANSEEASSFNAAVTASVVAYDMLKDSYHDLTQIQKRTVLLTLLRSSKQELLKYAEAQLALNMPKWKDLIPCKLQTVIKNLTDDWAYFFRELPHYSECVATLRSCQENKLSAATANLTANDITPSQKVGKNPLGRNHIFYPITNHSTTVDIAKPACSEFRGP